MTVGDFVHVEDCFYIVALDGFWVANIADRANPTVKPLNEHLLECMDLFLASLEDSDLFAEIPEGVSGMTPAIPEGICTAPSLAASAPASSWEIVSINPVIVELAPSPEEALPAASEAPENPDDPKWRRPLDRRAFRRQLARERAAFQEAQKKSQPKKWRRVTR